MPINDLGPNVSHVRVPTYPNGIAVHATYRDFYGIDLIDTEYRLLHKPSLIESAFDATPSDEPVMHPDDTEMPEPVVHDRDPHTDPITRVHSLALTRWQEDAPRDPTYRHQMDPQAVAQLIVEVRRGSQQDRQHGSGRTLAVLAGVAGFALMMHWVVGTWASVTVIVVAAIVLFVTRLRRSSAKTLPNDAFQELVQWYERDRKRDKLVQDLRNEGRLVEPSSPITDVTEVLDYPWMSEQQRELVEAVVRAMVRASMRVDFASSRLDALAARDPDNTAVASWRRTVENTEHELSMRIIGFSMAMARQDQELEWRSGVPEDGQVRDLNRTLEEVEGFLDHSQPTG